MASELRKRFENYLIVNRLAQKTQEAYLNAVAGLSKHYNQPPERLTDEQIQKYLVYLIRHRKLSWSSCNVNFSGLHCFYKKFLNRPQTEFSIRRWTPLFGQPDGWAKL